MLFVNSLGEAKRIIALLGDVLRRAAAFPGGPLRGWEESWDRQGLNKRASGVGGATKHLL